jgi:hypothetical protein
VPETAFGFVVGVEEIFHVDTSLVGMVKQVGADRDIISTPLRLLVVIDSLRPV